MILEELEILFEDLNIDEPTNEQMDKMYEVYLSDVCKVKFNNEILKVNKNKSRHPICKGKHQTFEHIITRESKHSGKRNFDNQRANRIHWIKPIVENCDDIRIKYYEAYNNKGQLQYFFFYEDKNFIVITRELPNGKMLITAYYIDDYRKRGHKKQYEEYRQKKTPLRERGT